MDREKWIKVGLEIVDHVKDIQMICQKNGMKMVDIVVFSNGTSWADHTDSDNNQWTAYLRRDGKTELQIDDSTYYTRT